MSIWFILLAMFCFDRNWNAISPCVPKSSCEQRNLSVDWEEKDQDGLRSVSTQLEVVQTGTFVFASGCRSLKLNPNVMRLRIGKRRTSSCDEYKEYPRLCFNVIHFNRAYTARKNLC